MKSALSLSLKEKETWKRFFPFLCILLSVGFAFQGLLNYLKPDLNLFLVLMAAPFVVKVKEPHTYSHRYLFLYLLFAGLFILAKMRIFFLFTLGTALLYFIESLKGKMGILPLLLVFFLSPVPTYLAEVFTFPIRLWMSGQTAEILATLGFGVSYQGNIFTVGENSFAVDPACMGLNSLVTGVILMILLIAFAENRHKKELSLLQLLGVGLTSLLLLIGSNFFRMLALVLFVSPAETLSHELIGLFSLLIYGIVPIYCLIEWITKHKASVPKALGQEKEPGLASYIFSTLIVLTIAVFSFQRVAMLEKPLDIGFTQIELLGFEKSELEGGINKYVNEDLLVYLKSPSRFWGSDHSPAICWKASGFTFAQVEEYSLGGKIIYLGQLKRGKEILHTAWWYDNGKSQTHSQIDWRIRRLQGEKPFLLVNVTADEKEEVLAYAQSLLTNPVFN